MQYTWQRHPEGQTLCGDEHPIGTLVPWQHPHIDATDAVETLGPGVFRWTRRFTLRGAAPQRVRLTLDFSARHAARYALIPAVSYNGNAWGTGQEPKGFAREGVPWSFAWHRVAVPGATYSEGPAFSVALFGPGDPGPEGFACTLLPEAGRTLHRLIWPEEEQPLVYCGRDEYAPPYRAELTLRPGEPFCATAWLVVAPVGQPRTAWRRFLDEAWRRNYRPQRPRYRAAELWQLGVRFAREQLWAEEGVFRGFSIGRLWNGRAWQQRERYKYEIGWAGQNASLACALLSDHLRTGDADSLRMGLATLDCWARCAPLPNGLVRCVFDRVLGQGRCPSVNDACNLGNAAADFVEACELAQRCGHARPQYLAAARGICDFILGQQRADGGLGKAWDDDGRCVDPAGTIGCYLIPGLLAVHRATRAPRYLAAAEAAYAFYSRGLLADGYTTAGALDTHCIDKESAYPLIESGLALHALTGQDGYLRSAEHASYYTASWQWHYRAPCRPGGMLAQMEYDSLGGTAVSTQHHHLDPYAVRVVPLWLELAERTGNPLWRERALAAWRNGMIGVSDGTLVLDGAPLPPGSQCEGYFHTRWLRHGDASLWLVAWPTAFRLEVLRRLADWSVLDA